MNAHMRMCTRTHNLPPPSATLPPLTVDLTNTPLHIIIHYIIALVLVVGCFLPPIIHFFVSIFIRDYVLRYGNACDYYSLCGFMILSLLNLCAYVHVCVCVSAWRLLNSEGLNRHKSSVCMCEYFWNHECLCATLSVFGCQCVLAYFVQLEKSWLSISGREAECVLWLSMEHLRDQIIAVSSASLPAWETHHIIIQLFPLSDENTKLVSSGLVIKQKNYNAIEPHKKIKGKMWLQYWFH